MLDNILALCHEMISKTPQTQVVVECKLLIANHKQYI